MASLARKLWARSVELLVSGISIRSTLVNLFVDYKVRDVMPISRIFKLNYITFVILFAFMPVDFLKNPSSDLLGIKGWYFFTVWACLVPIIFGFAIGFFRNRYGDSLTLPTLVMSTVISFTGPIGIVFILTSVIDEDDTCATWFFKAEQ